MAALPYWSPRFAAGYFNFISLLLTVLTLPLSASAGAIQHLSTWPGLPRVEGNTLQIVVYQDVAYVADSTALHVVDVADPEAPRLVTSLSGVFSGLELHFFSSYPGLLFGASTNGPLRLFYLSDPLQPLEVRLRASEGYMQSMMYCGL